MIRQRALEFERRANEQAGRSAAGTALSLAGDKSGVRAPSFVPIGVHQRHHNNTSQPTCRPIRTIKSLKSDRPIKVAKSKSHDELSSLGRRRRHPEHETREIAREKEEKDEMDGTDATEELEEDNCDWLEAVSRPSYANAQQRLANQNSSVVTVVESPDNTRQSLNQQQFQSTSKTKNSSSQQEETKQQKKRNGRRRWQLERSSSFESVYDGLLGARLPNWLPCDDDDGDDCDDNDDQKEAMKNLENNQSIIDQFNLEERHHSAANEAEGELEFQAVIISDAMRQQQIPDEQEKEEEDEKKKEVQTQNHVNTTRRIKSKSKQLAMQPQQQWDVKLELHHDRSREANSRVDSVQQETSDRSSMTDSRVPLHQTRRLRSVEPAQKRVGEARRIVDAPPRKSPFQFEKRCALHLRLKRNSECPLFVFPGEPCAAPQRQPQLAHSLRPASSPTASSASSSLLLCGADKWNTPAGISQSSHPHKSNTHSSDLQSPSSSSTSSTKSPGKTADSSTKQQPSSSSFVQKRLASQQMRPPPDIPQNLNASKNFPSKSLNSRHAKHIDASHSQRRPSEIRLKRDKKCYFDGPVGELEKMYDELRLDDENIMDNAYSIDQTGEKLFTR